MGEEAVQNTLDIGRPDPSLCNIFDCHVDSVPTRLYMLNECHTIKAVVAVGTELWKGTRCPLVILQHVKNNPRFARIITEEPTGVSDILYYVREKWTRIASNTSMTSLKEIQYTSHGLIVDINFPLGPINEVKAKWCGLDVQLFVPDESYYAKEVCLSGEQIWKQKKKEEKCIFIIVHLEHAFPIAVHLLVRDKNDAVHSFFSIRDGGFKSVTGREYYDKLAIARREICKCQQWSNRV